MKHITYTYKAALTRVTVQIFKTRITLIQNIDVQALYFERRKMRGFKGLNTFFMNTEGGKMRSF